MFRGYMPALTCLMFGIGLGIGAAWSRGWIPLEIGPAKTGSLSVEVAQQEELPLPNLASRSGKRRHVHEVEVNEPPDDPEIFEEQTEPEPDGSVAVVRSSVERDRTAVIPAVRVSEAASDEEADLTWSESTEELTNHPPQPALRRQREEPVAAENVAAVSKPRESRKNVRVVAHQESNGSLRESPGPSAESQDPSFEEQFSSAQAKLDAGEVLAAHRQLSKLYWNHKEHRPQLQDVIDQTAKAIFFQSQPHFIEPYSIQSGDRLEAIAKKYQLSWEYLARLNRTEPRKIQIGQKLKVLKGPFAAVVELRDFELVIHLQGYYVKRYTVCTGKDGSSPIGKFVVLNKVENPPYTGPDGKVIPGDDPSNPLGERWIDLGDSYGIHGTIDPDSIGKAESRGCIRLRDDDVVEVYNFLVKGSEVVIR